MASRIVPKTVSSRHFLQWGTASLTRYELHADWLRNWRYSRRGK
jgi:hypothetical protein